MEDWLEYVWLGNTVQTWLTALGIIILLLLVVRVIRTIVLTRLKTWSDRTEAKLDDFVIDFAKKSILPILYIAAIYSGLHYLDLSPKAERILYILMALVVTFFVIRLITNLIGHLLGVFITKRGKDPAKKLQLSGIMLVVNFLVWGIGLIFLFDNLGYDVTAVIAGLGIGGIAIALAAQNILGDLFNYFVIFFDRPFEVGDFIVVDDKKGNVEYIGIKTTRIKSLSGEQIVISNSNLTNSRLHNFKRMEERRIVFMLGVTYGTSVEKLKAIPEIIKKIFDEEALARLDRVHFAAYGDFSLNYEIVFFVNSPDYNQYMDVHQSVNLKIYEAFELRGIEFAFPTQTIHLAKQG